MNDKYIPNAVTAEDHLSNVQFQLLNVVGWIKHNRTNAAVKADCLLDAAQKLVEAFQKEELLTK